MGKEIIIYDDYNGRVRADQSCIGTLTTNCGNDAERNGVKIIEYEEERIERRGYRPRDIASHAGGGIPVRAYGAFDMSYPKSKTRRGRVQEGGDVAPTLTASNQEIAVVIPHIAAMRGRTPDDPSDRRRGSPTRQRIEIGSDETSNTLTSVQKDNLVVEPGCIVAGMLDIKGHEFIRRVHDAAIVVGNSVKSGHAAGNVVDDKGIAPTVMENHGTVTKVVAPGRRKVRVRKLTEKECWRLMAAKDEDYRLVARNQSSSSMYHLAGDSIVTTCNMAIFGELFGIEWRSKVRDLVEALKEKEDSV